MAVNIAVLWDRSLEDTEEGPLQDEDLSETYRVFSEIAESKGGKVFLANYRSYRNGSLDEAFVFEGGWQKVRDVEVDAVLDKFKFDDSTRALKEELTESSHVINKYELEEICKDKLLTYQRFPDLVPETSIASEQNVDEMLSENEEAVLKPRFDYGGRGIRLIDSMDGFEEKEDQIAQVFIDSSQGYSDLDVSGVNDLRIVVVNGSPQLAYFRLAEDGFISNVSKGGSIKFIDKDEVPEEALEVVQEISEVLDEWNPSYYSVDLVFDSENRPHVLELNSKPALNFYGDEEIKERKKPVMELLIDELLVEDRTG